MNRKNRQVIEEFRANGGVVTVRPPNGPVLLLHTRGAKTGQPCLTPLLYLEHADGYIIAASMGGYWRNPDWYHNLRVHPEVQVEVGRQILEMRAVVTEGAERDRLFGKLSKAYPQFAYYQRKTRRVIPTIFLERKPV
jgi:deazaflavin-dependent oxidoreductase (nitroreductase family)